MTRPGTILKVGVVGVGHLGRHHARLYAGMAGVQLVGVHDLEKARTQAVAAQTGSRPFSRLEDLAREVDAVSVAVPTVAHVQVAEAFLDHGIACLVEKPLAPDLPSGRNLVSRAQESGTLLMVGQTERFNPAMVAARRQVKHPGFIEAQRLGSFSSRSLDVDVVLDLMIHDIDAILDLVGERPIAVDAVGVAALTDKIDLANARLRFPSGCAANLTASRMSLGQVRKIRIFQPDAYITVDCSSREVLKYSLVKGEGPRPEIRGESVAVSQGEPLALELGEFVAAVKEKRPPRCAGEEGLAALEIALQIRAQMSRVQAKSAAGEA
ncbi:MAG: Gfo/Idh/MocA family protein [Acidobacteriota bacterium]